MIKRMGEDMVKLCCNGTGCPTVKDLGDGNVEITDDDGNKVIMKKEEAALITDGIKLLGDDKDQLLLG